MSNAMVDELGGRLADLLGAPVEIERAVLLPGGASKEAWMVDIRTPEKRLELLVRRAGGGVIYSETLSLELECRVLGTAYESGVKAPRSYGFIEDLAGREAFVMERIEGESIGRRIVQRPEFEKTRAALPRQLAEELARIHAVPLDDLASRLPGARVKPATDHVIATLESELDNVGEPHPVIELGLSWLREHVPRSHGIVLNHGDYRVGNFMVDGEGLVGVLDWEFAHLGDPAEDLAWPLVRAWRFGMDHLRLGGVGPVEPYLERYNELTGCDVTLEELFYWEVVGNVRWAIGALNQARRHLSGKERSVELAILGRLAAEVEYEILHLLERGN